MLYFIQLLVLCSQFVTAEVVPHEIINSMTADQIRNPLFKKWLKENGFTMDLTNYSHEVLEEHPIVGQELDLPDGPQEGSIDTKEKQMADENGMFR